MKLKIFKNFLINSLIFCFIATSFGTIEVYATKMSRFQALNRMSPLEEYHTTCFESGLKKRIDKTERKNMSSFDLNVCIKQILDFVNNANNIEAKINRGLYFGIFGNINNFLLIDFGNLSKTLGCVKSSVHIAVDSLSKAKNYVTYTDIHQVEDMIKKNCEKAHILIDHDHRALARQWICLKTPTSAEEVLLGPGGDGGRFPSHGCQKQHVFSALDVALEFEKNCNEDMPFSPLSEGFRTMFAQKQLDAVYENIKFLIDKVMNFIDKVDGFKIEGEKFQVKNFIFEGKNNISAYILFNRLFKTIAHDIIEYHKNYENLSECERKFFFKTMEALDLEKCNENWQKFIDTTRSISLDEAIPEYCTLSGASDDEEEGYEEEVRTKEDLLFDVIKDWFLTREIRYP